MCLLQTVSVYPLLVISHPTGRLNRKNGVTFELWYAFEDIEQRIVSNAQRCICVHWRGTFGIVDFLFSQRRAKWRYEKECVFAGGVVLPPGRYRSGDGVAAGYVSGVGG